MNIFRYILLILCILPGIAGFAQESATPPLRIHDAGNGEMKVHFHFAGVELKHAGGDFMVPYSDCLTLGNGRAGSPDLPTLSTLIRLPQGSTLELVDIDATERTLTGVLAAEGNLRLAPVTEGWFKDRDRPGYHPDYKIYNTDAWYRGGDLMEVEHLGRLGKEEIYRLTLRPVAYSPVKGDLRECTAVDATLKVGKAAVPPTGGDRVLLIVSRPEFRTGLQPFVRWKRQEGYTVRELYVSTHQRDSVKAAMRPWFDNASPVTPAPEYTLLVGDAAQLQSFIGSTGLNGESHTTDLPYADFTNDYLPDAMLGRWPVNDTAELRIVVEKTLRYEQFDNIDTAQLERMLLVAGEEDAGQALLTTNSQVSYVSREVKLAHPEMDTITYHNPESGTLLDSIKADIGRGASLLNYTAHCTVGGWTMPSLSIGQVEETAGNQPMVYVNNCCKSNTFSGTGFGEQLLRLPVGGAVGVIGATNSTLWLEDYFWAAGPKWPISPDNSYDSLTRGAFDALAGRRPTATTLGELLTAGNLAVTAYGSSYTRFYWEIYCLLGDPTLRPYIGSPQRTELRLIDTAHNGQNILHVGGTPGATVTAMQGDTLLGVCTLDNAGVATMQLRHTLDTLPLVLTATGAGLRPATDTAAVERTIGYGATLRSITVGDTSVTLFIENTGEHPFDSMHIMLHQCAGDSLNGAWIAPFSDTVHNLQPAERRHISLPVNVVSTGIQPLWQGRLTLTSAGHGMLCEMGVSGNLAVTYPTLTLRLLDANGNEARRLNAGGTYRVVASTSGPHDAFSLSAESFPNGERFTTTDSTLDFTLGDSLCAIHIDAATPLGHWDGHHDVWLEPGARTDSFEQGLESHPWQNTSLVPWTLDSTESHSGNYSLRSGAIDHGQTSRICLEVDMLHSDTIAYWVKTSCESENDRLIFSVDGRDFIPEAWGIGNWRQRAHLLEPGHHTLCWRYIKDATRSQGEDCVWIDDIQVPLAAWSSAMAWQCQQKAVDIAQPQSGEPFTFAPNPATGHVTLRGEPGTTIQITDVLGRPMTRLTLDGMPHQVSLDGWPAGIYFATAARNGGTVATHKLIVIKQQ